MSIHHGFLIDHFKAFGYKRLKPVEIDPKISHEHEFNGVNQFRKMLGSDDLKNIPCRVLYLSDDEDEQIEDHICLTWYDARRNHPTRTEYRLYYQDSDCFFRAKPEDLMVLCVNSDDTLTMFISKDNDTITNQLEWLFGLTEEKISTSGQSESICSDNELDYFSNIILSQIGVYNEPKDDSYLEVILEKFPNGFPKTRDFSAFARELVEDADPVKRIDNSIVSYLEMEEHLFKILEQHLLNDKIQAGFEDVDEFISFSLSVQNRRKSRAGYSFENHLRYVFDCNNIRYGFNEYTEKKSKPDFLFPGISEYRDSSYPDNNLSMLGVKTSCKERWGQVLAEADRVEVKHLCTLEPGISQYQTEQMQLKKLQLVVPSAILHTYNEKQQDWLLTIEDFKNLVIEKDV
jgi:hypothetical protein